MRLAQPAAHSSPRYAYIDSLRAIAALLVVLTHSSEVFAALTTNGEWIHKLAYALDFGRSGVVAFFAISGFVIPSSLHGGVKEGARRFLVRRLLRLYPAYWLSIPIGVVTTWWIGNAYISPAAILANFTMIQNALGFPDVQGLYWTLQTELIFYALCLALFLLGQMQSTVVLRALMIAFAAVFPVLIKSGFEIPSLVCLHMSIMFWGALWRKRQNGESLILFDRLLLWGFPASWAILALAAPLIPAGTNRFIASYAIGLCLFALGTTAIRIRHRFLAWMGEISYSTYLFHPAVVYSLMWLIARTGSNLFSAIHLSIYVLLSMALTTGLAALIYRWVEWPAIEMGRRLRFGDN